MYASMLKSTNVISVCLVARSIPVNMSFFLCLRYADGFIFSMIREDIEPMRASDFPVTLVSIQNDVFLSF
jgi:hypothetical protein